MYYEQERKVKSEINYQIGDLTEGKLANKLVWYITNSIYNSYTNERIKAINMKIYNTNRKLTQSTKSKYKQILELSEAKAEDIVIKNLGGGKISISVPEYYELKKGMLEKAIRDALVTWMINCRIRGITIV